MTKTRVVNIFKEKYDVFIGRGSLWGNPFRIGKDGNREQVIAKYDEYITDKIMQGEIKLSDVLALDGLVLGCYCKPQACHGDVLVRIINEMKDWEVAHVV